LINLAPNKTFFSDRGLRRIVLSSIVPRLPASMNALALTMLVQSQTNSFASARSMSAAYMIAAANLPCCPIRTGDHEKCGINTQFL
jgi:hypothetical protein